MFQHATPEETPKQKLFIVISSDKGLCGGVHTSVTKATRRALSGVATPTSAEDAPPIPAASPESPIMVIGDKSKAQLSRALGKNLVLSFNQIGKDVPTFADATGVADLVVKSGVKYDSVNIVYNKFVSALSYEPAVYEVLNEEGLKEAREFIFRSSAIPPCIQSFQFHYTTRTCSVTKACFFPSSTSGLQGVRDGRRRNQGSC